MRVLGPEDVKIIRLLPPERLNAWALDVYKSGFRDGLEKAEDDFAADAEILSCEKVVEKLIKADFSEEEANYILEVLLTDE